MTTPDQREWLEADDLGGFAMGTVSGIRTRRYHSLLTVATRPPAGRLVLVPGLEAWIETDAGPLFLSSHLYAPDVIHPDGFERLAGFHHQPWPTWTFRLDDGLEMTQELVCDSATGHVVVSWRISRGHQARLAVRPLLAARDSHSLQHENSECSFDAEIAGGNVAWQLYPDQPGVTALTSGRYDHAPVWYRQFSYELERERGLDHLEDLASPGVFRFELNEANRETLIVLKGGHDTDGDAPALGYAVRVRERALRAATADPIELAARVHLVRGRGPGHRSLGEGGLTIIAGYPWFTDWGRDTFIAIRGLCLATGHVDDALQVLSAWAGYVSEGMLPNRFPDAGETPEYNSVDAALWYVVAVGELLDRTTLEAGDRRRLMDAVQAILSGYEGGTRYGIRADRDGLLAAGEPGVQLTWMDAKVGDWVVTPRIGKPVEIQALWINALAVGERVEKHWRRCRERAVTGFLERFPRGDGSLYDVVDVDHEAGRVDDSFRPNQIFAAGGLPVALLKGAAARALVDAVEARLWTPLGLRSLDPQDPRYRGRYQGGVLERDGAYHQGTVWPWLAGAFVEAWLAARDGSAAARAEARRRFVAPLERRLDEFGLGSLPEIADGDAPHTPRGAPFQAWSMSELVRLRRLVGDEP